MEEPVRQKSSAAGRVAVVAIGRNEGTRLVRCLDSVADSGVPIVYVDSGSRDDSVARAHEAGARVVELSSDLPFTAARARNAGFAALAAEAPDYVQFVDGDTALCPGWLDAARAHLDAHPEVAIACGGLRERDPEASLYHRLADLEWRGPSGEIRSAGGNAMVRAETFRRVGGYDGAMIAGEDPELCVRVRAAGLGVVRLDRPMGVHDAGPLGFAQWWRRNVRDGHAYAEIRQRQGDRAEPYWNRRLLSIVAWGGLLPAAIVLLLRPRPWLALLGLAALAVQGARQRGDLLRRGLSPRDATRAAALSVLGKLAGFLGVVTFAWNRGVRGRSTGSIEHESRSPAEPPQ